MLGDDTLDITKDIIALLNKKLKSIKETIKIIINQCAVCKSIQKEFKFSSVIILSHLLGKLKILWTNSAFWTLNIFINKYSDHNVVDIKNKPRNANKEVINIYFILLKIFLLLLVFNLN